MNDSMFSRAFVLASQILNALPGPVFAIICVGILFSSIATVLKIIKLILDAIPFV